MKIFTAIIEKCSDTGLYVGSVPGFPGAHSQAETLDELNKNLKDVIEMLLEDGEPKFEGEFIGTQNVMGSVPVLKPQKVASILERLGFLMIEQMPTKAVALMAGLAFTKIYLCMDRVFSDSYLFSTWLCSFV